jgi:hypothetical protein
MVVVLDSSLVMSPTTARSIFSHFEVKKYRFEPIFDVTLAQRPMFFSFEKRIFVSFK